MVNGYVPPCRWSPAASRWCRTPVRCCWSRRPGAAGLDRALSQVLGRWRQPLALHDPGKIVVDLAVAVALGGDAASDIAVVRAQPGVFGLVASDPTVSRLISRLAEDDAGRAGGDPRRPCRGPGTGLGPRRGAAPGRAGGDRPGRHADHRALGQAVGRRRTWKKAFGFHPLLRVRRSRRGGTGEPVAELLRPGKAGSNTADRSHRGARRRAGPAARGSRCARRRRPARRCWCAPTPPAPPRSSPRTWPPTACSSPLGAYLHHFDIHRLAILPTKAWTPAYAGPQAPRRRCRRADRAPRRAPGSPRPPVSSTCRPGRPAPG